jgi:hypothetical protein
MSLKQGVKMKLKSLGLALLLAAAPAFAADVDGKWDGSLDTPGGAVAISYTFKAEGAKLTGTSAAPDGTPVPIKNGKIDGNKISFSLDVDFGQGPITFEYTGVVSPTEIKLHSSFMDMPLDFALKKAS